MQQTSDPTLLQYVLDQLKQLTTSNKTSSNFRFDWQRTPGYSITPSAK